VLNLIINAIEAADGDGQVKIRVARAEDDRAEAGSPRPGSPAAQRRWGGPGQPAWGAGEFEDEAIVEVSDNGCGIGEEDLTRIFNPFFTTRPGGTGLGLPAVRRIARAHGGRIEVKSSLGKGSTFALHLPINPPQ
jgi:two-component system NtrC family sensor kinase